MRSILNFKNILNVVFIFLSLSALSQQSSNYTFTNTTNGTFDNMSGATPIYGPNQDETTVGTAVFQPFDMDFLFMGEFWNSLKVSTNGVIWFGNDTDFFPEEANNIGDIPNSRRISAFAMSESGSGGLMKTSSNGSIVYKTFGTAPNRHVTIRFQRMGCSINSTTGDVTTQVKIYETNSKIELIYDQIRVNATPIGDISAGFQVDNESGKRYTIDLSNSSTSTTNAISYRPANKTFITNVNTTSEGNRRKFTFESIAPNGDPSDLTGFCQGSTSLGLNWTDNSSNELGFVVYGSSDGGSTYSRYSTVGANETTATLTGLTPSTAYTFKVFSFTEGQVSELSGPEYTFTTTATGTANQTIKSGNWYDNSVWSNGAYPTSNTDAIIGCLNNHVIFNNNSLNVRNVEVKTGSTWDFDSRTVNMNGNLINNGSIIIDRLSATLKVKGDLTNTGTIDLSSDNTLIELNGDLINSGSFNTSNNSTVELKATSNSIINHTGTSTTASLTELDDNNGLPVAIPDRSRRGGLRYTGSDMTVATGLGDLVEVRLNISHTFNADLEIRLIAPDGTIITLAGDHGGNGNGYINVTFKDNSGNNLPTGSTTITGDYNPEENLSNYTGGSGGTWRLEVADDAGGDTGDIESWGLVFKTTTVLSNTLVFENLVINTPNGSDYTIENTDILINDDISFTNGIIKTQDVADHKVILSPNSSVLGSITHNNHIEGKILKQGNTDFTFPIGDDNFSAPIKIEFGAGSNADDEFLVSYHHQSPATLNTLDADAPYDDLLFDAPITKVSDQEYWLLSQENNSGTPLTVSLSYDASRGTADFASAADLRVAHWTNDGSSFERWKDEGNGGSTTAGPFNAISSAGTIDNFSPLTLASINVTLPVDWLDIEAYNGAHGTVLDWSTIENDQTLQYTVQRSMDGVNFSNVSTIEATNQSNEQAHYNLVDSDAISLHAQHVYYRVYQEDINGENSYSKIVAVDLDEASVNVGIFPNPFSNEITVNFSSETTDEMEIIIMTIEGRLVYETTQEVQIGTNEIIIPTDHFINGSYVLHYKDSNISGNVLLEK